MQAKDRSTYYPSSAPWNKGKIVGHSYHRARRVAMASMPKPVNGRRQHPAPERRLPAPATFSSRHLAVAGFPVTGF